VPHVTITTTAPLSVDAALSIEGTTYTSAYAGDPAKAIAALPPSGGIVVIDQSAAVAATIWIPANVILAGRPGCVLTGSDPTQDVFALVNIAGVRLFHLTIAGGKSAVAGYAFSDVEIRGCRISGWHYRAVDLGAGTPNTTIHENQMTAPDPGMVDAIFAQDSGARLVIARNLIDTTGCNNAQAHGIALHTSAANGTMIDALVENNYVTHAGGNFGLEIGAFGGARPTAPIARNNRFRFAAKTNGGISLASSDDAQCVGNVIDMNGVAPDIMAIELVNSVTPLAIGNTVRNGPADARALVIDTTARALVINNALGGNVFITNSGTVPNQPRLDHNIVAYNHIAIPDGSVYPNAIYLHANAPGCQAVQNRIEANDIFAPAGCNLITLEQSAGTIDGTVVTGNLGAPPVQQIGGVTNTIQASYRSS
jgi:hypothetical protein